MTHPDTTETQCTSTCPASAGSPRCQQNAGHKGMHWAQGPVLFTKWDDTLGSPMPDNEPLQAAATDKGPVKLSEDQYGDWYWTSLEMDSPLHGPHTTKEAVIAAIGSLGYTYTPPAAPKQWEIDRGSDSERTMLDARRRRNDLNGDNPLVVEPATTPLNPPEQNEAGLLPCPHCGPMEDGIEDIQFRKLNEGWGVVECTRCSATGPMVPAAFDSTWQEPVEWKPEAASEWNKRAQ